MEQLENRPGIAQQCESLGDIFLKQGNLQNAEIFLSRVIALYEAMQDTKGLQQAQDKLVYLMGKPEYINRRQEELLSELKKPELEKDDESRLAALSELGNLYFMAGNMDQAASRMRETADLQEKLKDEAGLGSTLDSLGSILKEKNDLEGAEECFGCLLYTSPSPRD